MRRFAFAEPPSVAAATQMLADKTRKAMPLAGGIDLLGELKERIVEPEVLVNLKTIRELDFVRFDSDGTLRLGALATLTAVADHERVTISELVICAVETYRVRALAWNGHQPG